VATDANKTAHSNATRAPQEELPGDPACWLKRVCPACGTLADADPPTVCAQCHAAITGE
jgi:rubrerythrin